MPEEEADWKESRWGIEMIGRSKTAGPVRFLRANADKYGYDADHLHFFRQETAPAADMQGRVLLDRKYALAASPNGNGGWFRSLDRAGFTGLLEKEGIDYLNVFAVDNVLQNICDPVFIAFFLAAYECSTNNFLSK